MSHLHHLQVEISCVVASIATSSLRGAKATKQSRILTRLHWIASLALAMTAKNKTAPQGAPFHKIWF
jgi:hypothetical protein